MSDAVRADLAPNGTLRAGINMSNFLLVTGQTPEGDPDGVSPDMARAVAELAQMHWSYLNSTYHPTVLSEWTSGGCMDDIRRQVTRDLTDIFEQTESLRDVDNYLRDPYEYWRFDVDTEKAVRRGISVDTINQNLAMAMGGNVRTGMEDTIYYARGELVQSNAQLVERMVRLAREIGREPATVEEAREMLDLS